MQRRVIRRTAAVTAALTIAALTSAAGAQQSGGGWGGSQQQGRQFGMRQMGQERAGESRLTSIRGTISELKEISINGREPHVFAKVDDENGTERTVNLGPADDVADKVNEGDEIEVRAVNVPMLGSDLYHTVVLRTGDGETMRVRQIQDPKVRAALRERMGERWEQQQGSQRTAFRQDGQQQSWMRESGQDRAGGRMTSIRGTVSKMREVSIGDREPYLFAKVEDENGTERTVNLGPADEVADKINQGDEIEVRAVNVPMLDRDVYHTVALRTADGETLRVRQIQNPELRSALRERARERLEGRGFQPTAFRGAESDQGASRELGLDSPGAGRMTSLEGRISELKEVALDDREPFLVVKLEDNYGVERTVNLGPADEVSDLCSEGDEIEVRAVRLPVFGRDVYHALLLNTNGQTKRIHQIRDPEVRAALRERVQERLREQRSSGQQAGGQIQ